MHCTRDPLPTMRSFQDLLSRAVIALFLLAGAWTAAFAQQSPMPVAPASVASGASSAALPPIQAPAAAANPYGLQALWAQGDWVARITLLILAAMSLASWYVLIRKLAAQSRM